MSPSNIMKKMNAYADNLEYFSKAEILTKDSCIKEFAFGRMVGEIAYSPSGWCDVLSSGLKKHYISFGVLETMFGHKIYNFTLWNIAIIFGFRKGIE